MKAKRLFLALAMVVFAIGSVSAQEKTAVKKFNDDGTVNKSVLTKEELRWEKLADNAQFEELTAGEKAESLRARMLAFDNYYRGEDGLLYTNLTREKVVEQGFHEFVYEMIDDVITRTNKTYRELKEKVGEDAIKGSVMAFNEFIEKYRTEDRPKMVAEMNAALKQAETEEAAEKAK